MKTVLSLAIITLVLAGAACTVKPTYTPRVIKITSRTVTRTRRSQLVANPDAAHPMRPGQVALSFGYKHAVDPFTTVELDSTVSIDDTSTADIYIRTDVNESYFYESRTQMAGDIMFAVTEWLGAGVYLSRSTGALHAPGTYLIDAVTRDVMEYAAYARLIRRFTGDFTLLYRPEVHYYTVNGGKVITYTNSESDVDTENRTSFRKNSYSIKHTFAMNVPVYRHVSVFGGFNLDKRPFRLTEDDDLEFETVACGYAGLGYRFPGGFDADVFMVRQIASDYTDHEAPLQLGCKLTLNLYPLGADEGSGE